MKQKHFILIFAIAFMILIICLVIFPYKLTKKPDNYVIRVIDGDTFKTYSGEIIRLLCIDTPEIGKENYEEAKEYLESLILGEDVELIVSLTDQDKYNRSLRYVYVNDQFVNKLVLDNYGELLIIPPEECWLVF